MSHPNPSPVARYFVLPPTGRASCAIKPDKPDHAYEEASLQVAVPQTNVSSFSFFLFSLSHRVASYRIGLHRTFTVGEAPAPPPPPPPLSLHVWGSKSGGAQSLKDLG